MEITNEGLSLILFIILTISVIFRMVFHSIYFLNEYKIWGNINKILFFLFVGSLIFANWNSVVQPTK
jgi:hypothetical protein